MHFRTRVTALLSRRPLLLLLLLLATAPALPAAHRALAQSPQGSPPWPTIALQEVATGFAKPVYLTHAGDGSGRLFVVEKAGKIFIIDNGVKQTAPFLDIVSKVNSVCNECGLLGLAFPPTYASDGYFFVSYTGKGNPAPPVLSGEPSPTLGNDNVLARYRVSTVNPNLADSANEERILTINQPYQNHNGGAILFGPDNLLYMGVGDGGSGGDPLKSAQNLASPLGKILRIEVGATGTYTVPPDNPFLAVSLGLPSAVLTDTAYNNWLPLISVPEPTPIPTVTPTPTRTPTFTPTPEPTLTPTPVPTSPLRAAIWAYGLRNPWRFSFDATTSDLWIGDVGQSNWEEVDFVPAAAVGGQNYGWSILEGTHCYPPRTSGCSTTGKTQPIHEYDRAVGQSITGGYVYRGDIAALRGIYIYGDFSAGKIFGLRNEGGAWQSHDFLEAGFGIPSFGQGPDGALYVVDFGGLVHKIVLAP